MAQPGSMYKVGCRLYVPSQAVYDLAGAHEVIALADGRRVMDKLLPRWRAKLPPRFSQDFIDGFITRNRGALEAVVARAMMLRGASLKTPKTPEALAADLVPESFGLIHEYYTPTAVAESIPELLYPLRPELAGNDGIVRPSTGIGAEAEQDKELMGSFTSELDAVLDEDEDD